jgi:2-dehydropantoate 2-reductase
MRIAVMATGAVGGYFGARLAAAGHDVFFIARGSNLSAIRANGLRVQSVLGDLHLEKPNVTDHPGDIGQVDVVLFAVKLWDSEKAAQQAASLIGADTRVIPLQNGIDSAERISPILGADKVVAGSAYIATVLSSPGTVTHTSNFARMLVGRIDGSADSALAHFCDSAKAAGIDIELSRHIQAERWQKFAFLVALSGATTATRRPLGELLADEDTRALFQGLLSEVVAIAQARGIGLPSNLIQDRMQFADNSPRDFKASMCHDLERGNRLELDWLAGTVVRLGRELGVPTPWNNAVYAVLKPHRAGGAGVAAATIS